MQPGLADTPYCGAPPLPGAVAWNLDPALIGVLLAGLLLSRWGMRGAGEGRWLAAGWAALALLLVSPLCNLSVALFSARVGQHVLLLGLVAPMLALAAPAGRGRVGGMAAAAGVFAAALWLWHLPAPYAATFRSDFAYWAMQASLVGSAAWLWHGLLHGAARRPDAALLVGVATTAQMGALGAFLTFAPRPLFAPHAFTTLPFGLTPLEDQQLGGLLMWVPGGLVFALVALPALARVLRADPVAPAGPR